MLIVLAGVVYYVSQQPTPQEAQANANNPTILSFATTDATKLVITGGGKTTEIDRTGNGWQIVKPIQTPADPSRVNDWLSQLGNLTADQKVKSSSDLAQYGLTRPELNVTVSLQAGKSARLTLGDKTPDGNDYYAQVPNDQAVYLVSATLGDDLKSALTNPPKARPTPTPQPTLVPAITPTAVATPSGTPSATATPAG